MRVEEVEWLGTTHTLRRTGRVGTIVGFFYRSVVAVRWDGDRAPVRVCGSNLRCIG